MCAPKPTYKTGRERAHGSIQGRNRRHNARRTQAREQHERKGGACENNAAINTTRRGKGDAYVPVKPSYKTGRLWHAHGSIQGRQETQRNVSISA